MWRIDSNSFQKCVPAQLCKYMHIHIYKKRRTVFDFYTSRYCIGGFDELIFSKKILWQILAYSELKTNNHCVFQLYLDFLFKIVPFFSYDLFNNERSPHANSIHQTSESNPPSKKKKFLDKCCFCHDFFPSKWIQYFIYIKNFFTEML